MAKGISVESKIIDLIFESVPIVVLGMFAGLAALLTSKRHLSVRAGIGVFATASLVVLACDMLAIENGASVNMRIFFGVAAGFCARDLISIFRERYKKYIDKKLS